MQCSQILKELNCNHYIYNTFNHNIIVKMTDFVERTGNQINRVNSNCAQTIHSCMNQSLNAFLFRIWGNYQRIRNYRLSNSCLKGSFHDTSHACLIIFAFVKQRWLTCRNVSRGTLYLLSKPGYFCQIKQEAQLSPRDRAMRRVSWNLANCHATVQKLLVQVLNQVSAVANWPVRQRRAVDSAWRSVR